MLRERLAELDAALASARLDSGDPDEAARAALRFLVVRRDVPSPESLFPTPDRCPNCGQPCPSRSSPYCGEECRERSAFVRQFRRHLSDRSCFDVERQTALGQVLWSLLGGGYPRRIALIPARTREQVLRRDGGMCQICGAPATSVEHARTACNRPINLHAVCAKCARTRAFDDPEFASRPSVRQAMEEMVGRIAVEEPRRLSDDPDTWDWRAFLKRRNQ